MSKRRVAAALGVALLVAPGTWLRTHVPETLSADIALKRFEVSSETGTPDWELAGVWQYSTGPDLRFGGFSAIMAIEDNKLVAFSDRGTRFTITEPDSPLETAADRVLSFQSVARERGDWFWDIEAATRDPATGDYWLSYEIVHTIHRFSDASEPEEIRELDDEVSWTSNAGAEAMVRLSDGRFLVLAEGKREAMIFAGDPAEGADFETVPFVTPAASYVVTDLAQLPDGRVLLLMRNLAWSWPPFDSLIAIADPPPPGSTDPWEPKVALRFDNIIPNENYEGLTVREMPDGRVAVWVIADDNIAAIQRSLLVKLVFDPAASESAD